MRKSTIAKPMNTIDVNEVQHCEDKAKGVIKRPTSGNDKASKEKQTVTIPSQYIKRNPGINRDVLKESITS